MDHNAEYAADIRIILFITISYYINFNQDIVLTLPETNQMHDQDRKFMQDWEETREKGRWFYGLTHGTLFGFVIFILVNLFKLKDMSFVDVFFTQKAMIQLLTMALAGFLGYSTIKWWMNQNIYNKIIYKDKHPSEMH